MCFSWRLFPVCLHAEISYLWETQQLSHLEIIQRFFFTLCGNLSWRTTYGKSSYSIDYVHNLRKKIKKKKENNKLGIYPKLDIFCQWNITTSSQQRWSRNSKPLQNWIRLPPTIPNLCGLRKISLNFSRSPSMACLIIFFTKSFLNLFSECCLRYYCKLVNYICFFFNRLCPVLSGATNRCFWWNSVRKALATSELTEE